MFTHISLTADIWNGVSTGNPLLFKTGAILLTYTNAHLLIQVITFSQRPGLHTHTHTQYHSKAAPVLLVLTPTDTTHHKKNIPCLFWPFAVIQNVSAQKMAGWGKAYPIYMIYDLCGKENSFFFPAHILFFFSPECLVASVHWYCPLVYHVLAAISTLSPFIINRLYTTIHLLSFSVSSLLFK